MKDGATSIGVIVEGSAKVSERDRERYLELVKAVVAVSLKRSGCLKFAVAEDIAQRNLFHVTEAWTDMTSLDASRFGDENMAMLRTLAPLDITDRSVLIHQVVRSEPG